MNRSKHKYYVKRAIVNGTALYQTELILADLAKKPGRKRQRAYESSQTQPRKSSSCGSFGHFPLSCPSPNIGHLVEIKREKAVGT